MPEEAEARLDWLREQRLDNQRFLVGFTDLDLDALRPGQQADLLERMVLIASGFPEDIPDRMPKISVKTAKALQYELRGGFDALRQRRPYVIKGLNVNRILSISPGVERGNKVFRRPIGSHYQSRDPRSGFLMHAWDLLESVDFDRIRGCLTCGRIFLATKRQIYCSPSCSQKTRMQRYLEAHKGELRQRRRQAYERRQREKLGGKVKVARRAQKEG